MPLLPSSRPLSVRLKVHLERQSSPLFSTTSNIPFLQVLSFDIDTTYPRYETQQDVTASRFRLPAFQKSHVPAPVLHPPWSRNSVTPAATRASYPPSAHPSSRWGGTHH